MRDDTITAIRNPRFASGMVLVAEALMRRLGVTEITVNVREETQHGEGIEVAMDFDTGEITMRVRGNN